jgi:hypothetical protein
MTLSWADNRAVQIEKSPLVRSYMHDRLKCYNVSFPCQAWIDGLRTLCRPFGRMALASARQGARC